MLKKEFFANSLEDAAKPSRPQEKEDAEEKSISYFVEILQQLNLSFFNMYIRLRLEGFILQVKDLQLLVSLFISQKILKLEKLFLKVVP